GTKSFNVTLKTAGNSTVTASDVTHASIAASTSPAIAVSTAAFSRLQVLVPGQSAAPGSATGRAGTPTSQVSGAPFNITVNAVDAFFNPVTTVTDTVSFASSDGFASLPGAAPLSSGTQTFSVTLKTIGSQTLTASDSTDGGKTPDTSSAITVTPGAFARLQLLVPGETAAPGSATGKTGTPAVQTAGTAFSVIVNAVDTNWNVINTNDTVAITSSDPNAVLPA